VVKNLPANEGDTRETVRSLGSEEPFEEEMATHSGILAWRFPWTEKPGRLKYMGHKELDAIEHTRMFIIIHY